MTISTKATRIAHLARIQLLNLRHRFTKATVTGPDWTDPACAAWGNGLDYAEYCNMWSMLPARVQAKRPLLPLLSYQAICTEFESHLLGAAS